MLRHLRPGRDEPRHADRRRDDGLGPDRASSPARCAPTCSAPTASRRPTSFGITMPIVKHSFMIQHPRRSRACVHEAFHIARTGRPGPVLVDIPQDLSRAEIDYEPRRRTSDLPGYQPTTEGNIEADPARRQGARQRPPAGDLRRRRRHQRRTPRRSCASSRSSDRFPVTCTLMGLGAFPAPHEQWLGMLGMHGTRAANYAMDEADLIVAIGARFDDRITGKLSRVRAARQVHPHRRRPGRDLQERPGPHPDRRRREATSCRS